MKWVVLFALSLGIACLGRLVAADDLYGAPLIRMQSRTFDMRVDPDRVYRYGHFIPINRVRWVQSLISADPYLKYTVIHIQDRQTEHGVLQHHADWLDKYRKGGDVPEKLQVEGFDVFWRDQRFKKTGGILLFPRDDPYAFDVYCAYIESEGWPKFCGLLVYYPTEPMIRVMVRVYGVTRPFNDFREIAKRALSLVSCLDVSEDVAAGTWRASVVDGHDVPADVGVCYRAVPAVGVSPNADYPG